MPARIRNARVTKLTATFAAVLTVTGCAGSAATSASPDTADGYPVQLENCGRTVSIPAPPQRAVSLNQGSTEILLSLGLADRMVGTATWTDPVRENLAADNAGVERLADNHPSLERVLQTEPDLVTASFASTLGPGGVTTPEALEQLGIPSYLSPADCIKNNDTDGDGSRDAALEMDTVYQEITDLAEIFGVPDRGAALVEELQTRMAAAADTAPGAPVRVLFWFANSESPYLAGCCGAPGIIARTLGLTNVFDDTNAEWPQVNWETVADRDPDVLIIGDLTRKSQTAESAAAKIEFLKSHPVTRELTAVREQRYIPLSGAAMNPSIRTVDGVEQVAAALREFGFGG
ncbi:ABC transporter substrate-binding protein [Mycolicibacterium thermoresistibile]|jgi:iron complex transport system substrate-binding protein|uniref:Periplasmic binding protein n=2 Tax=Mycolicibacterium thermoresistibile TaxID=1797 RepID=A0A124E819_MYCTH|nr:ABC transporter substrate-binding protein [Mycolicibacterium thermoresistibile]EHI14259.1 putative ABC transporter solute-binding protein [Mycolicibacterium thermoresistibile ATCC 19527]MCV7187196.1 ABC transporter substrate-binding protein [Mycolicibacterium thermoresistibile]GAT14336.1 periplasmic binding protein [Mycolicibacterium thermoresistibile]SNW20672.1 Fe3+-siderophores ABC transporter substrate-binding protein [Mycolicibacterium thermoresistibile]